MSERRFFITTPIYYSNSTPHVGNAYASIVADVFARYRRLSGDAVKFSTGVDENSQKVVEKATEAGMPIMEYCDLMAGKHQAVWDGLSISYTDFVRTTSASHKEYVQKVLQTSFDRGDIYLGEYDGLYCVGCEAFKKESDLTPDGLCPDHKKAPVRIREKNYFFRLSKYQDALLEWYASNPDFVTPRYRAAEAVSFIKEGLEDFSISRETNTFGIPMPFDASHVAYVWYDALFNYVSCCQGGDEAFWPADVHVVGKDILKFHGIYWPAMLMSAGLPLPKRLLVTGHFTIDGQKISKSLGNAIDPVELAGRYSRDFLVLYLLSATPVGQDGDFSVEQAKLLHNAKLANNLGNLLNRFLVLTLKNGGVLEGITENASVAALRTSARSAFEGHMGAFDPKSALDTVFAFLDELNRFVDERKPWNEPDADRNRETLFTVGKGLATVATLLKPFFGPKMEELLVRIGLDASLASDGADAVSRLEVKEKGEPLYARFE